MGLRTQTNGRAALLNHPQHNPQPAQQCAGFLGVKVNCNECQGTGFVKAQRIEDSYECCDGATYYCDACEEEIPIDEVEDESDEIHYCLKHRIED